MTTNPSEKTKRNQIIFIEYSKVSENQHFITIVDSYRNILGRVFKDNNSKCELRDHTGRTKLKGTTLQKIKNLYLKHEEEILANAHKRRLALKSKKKKNENQISIPVE